jgi:hypothetical protein
MQMNWNRHKKLLAGYFNFPGCSAVLGPYVTQFVK